MITTIRRLCIILVSITFFNHSKAQDLRGFNQNSSRSNHLSISISPLYSTATHSGSDSLLFRGSGSGFRVGGDYFFGNAGIGFSSGFGSSSPDDATINNFLKHSSLPQDQLQITKSRQQNMYLLLGPSFRCGKNVELYAHAKAGLFINNSGLVSLQQRGAIRAIYRNESTDKNIYPGFLTGMSVQYRTRSDVWSFGIGADYLNTRSEVNNYDARRGGGIEALKLSRNITDVVAGITVRYNILSPRDHAGGQSTGRVLPTVNKRELAASRDAASGLATGKRNMINNETGLQNNSSNCGSVTKKITKPDGTTEELTFACPKDAADYGERTGNFSERATWTSSNPAKTISNADGSRGIISGRLTWSSANAGGIISNAAFKGSSFRGGSLNMNSQTGSTRQTNQSSFGTLVRLSARESGSGLSTGRRSRDAGSGLATGRRQYEPIFFEGEDDVCNPCVAKVKMGAANTNPLYNDKGNSATNPLYDKRSSGQHDDDCDGIAGANIYLVDAATNTVVAKTKTEPCGDFFFANVPGGDYVVRIAGSFSGKKGYTININSKTDLLGEVSSSEDWMQLEIYTSSDDENKAQKAGISTSRSNIRTKTISIIEADLDGDGELESLKATGTFSDGSTRDLTTGNQLKTQAGSAGMTGIVLSGDAFLTTRRRVEVLKSNKQGDPDANRLSSIAITNNNNRLTATATFSDGSTRDVTESMQINEGHPGVRQYTLTIGDVDGDGMGDAIFKTKTKSNQSNDRLAAGDADGDDIWSPRSNIKMIRVAAGDLDGDEMTDLAAGNHLTEFSVSREQIKSHFETGDKPTEQQRLVGGFLPGGAVISSAMRPGDPIPDIDVRLNQNSDGALVNTIQTNEAGEFEFTGLKEGNYSVSFDLNCYIDDETMVHLGPGNPSENIVTSESNLKDMAVKKGDVKLTASQNSQSLRAQNNNMVRSNRTDNALVLDSNNDAENIAIDEGGISGPGQKTTPANSGPRKWIAPEATKRAINTSHSNLRNMLVSLDALEEQLESDQSNEKSVINTSRSNIKSQRAAISALEEALDNLQAKDKSAAMNELDQKTTAMNRQFHALQEALAVMGNQYTSISNVLKSRHETAMASIRNMK